MTIHTFIQVQYFLCLIQALNIVLVWRSLALLKQEDNSERKKAPLAFVWMVFVATTTLVTGAFILQSYICWGEMDWVRTPTIPWKGAPGEPLPLAWHLLGFFGTGLFAARFWIQWWQAEHYRTSSEAKKSEPRKSLVSAFWWTSLVGSILALTYFIRMGDWVNILGYSFGLIVYVRNLVLINKESNTNLDAKTQRPVLDLFIFAGEHSGDLHGSHLIRALRQRLPHLRIGGVGGPKMRQEGMECLLNMECFQVMGFSDVIRALPKLWKHFTMLKKTILAIQPSAVLFIDYPEFNMQMAKALRKKSYGGKLIHYVCPTVWAWRGGRVKGLVATLDRLLTIFPFEEKCFSQSSLPVTYVGNPLWGSIQRYEYKDEWKALCGLKEGLVIGVFPGSRLSELRTNLAVQLQVAKRMVEAHPEARIAVSVVDPQQRHLIEEIIQQSGLRLQDEVVLVPRQYNYELMRECHVALATSGTVTLEIALHGVPTVVTYQPSLLNYLIAKHVFRIKLTHFCIVNIVCGKEVFAEVIAKKLDVYQIYACLENIYGESAGRQVALEGCEELKVLLNGIDSGLDSGNKAAIAIEKELGGIC